MKGAVIGGLAGISGVANVVDEQYLKKRLGFKRRDSTYSSFVRGSVIGLVGAVALAWDLYMMTLACQPTNGLCSPYNFVLRRNWIAKVNHAVCQVVGTRVPTLECTA